MSDSDRATERVDPTRVEIDRETTELKQTGCCEFAQADGIPCPTPDCSCETCRRSRLSARVRD